MLKLILVLLLGVVMIIVSLIGIDTTATKNNDVLSFLFTMLFLIGVSFIITISGELITP